MLMVILLKWKTVLVETKEVIFIFIILLVGGFELFCKIYNGLTFKTSIFAE